MAEETWPDPSRSPSSWEAVRSMSSLMEEGFKHHPDLGISVQGQTTVRPHQHRQAGLAGPSGTNPRSPPPRPASPFREALVRRARRRHLHAIRRPRPAQHPVGAQLLRSNLERRIATLLHRSSRRTRLQTAARALPVPAALSLCLLLASTPIAATAQAQATDGAAGRQACLAELARIERGVGGFARDRIAGRLARATAHCNAGQLDAAADEIERIHAALRRARAHRSSGGR